MLEALSQSDIGEKPHNALDICLVSGYKFNIDKILGVQKKINDTKKNQLIDLHDYSDACKMCGLPHLLHRGEIYT